jgi:hypothetical protein
MEFVTERAPDSLESHQEVGMLLFYCECCRKNTVFLTINKTSEFAVVSRSTLYYWMEREWIHWRALPSGRRVICRESLSHSVRSCSSPPPEVGRNILS